MTREHEVHSVLAQAAVPTDPLIAFVATSTWSDMELLLRGRLFGSDGAIDATND